MNISSAKSRRPRRFFGLRGVVRRPRRVDAGAAGASGRPRGQPDIQTDRALQSERARFAVGMDRELRLACRSEATLRRELGCAARELMRRRSYGRLGFVRLGDYARERLGVSARTLQCAAWLATRLDALPAVSRVYDRSELTWSQARLICRVAVAADEEPWLALARRSTVEVLERLVARARQPEGVPADPEGTPNEIDGEPAVRWRFARPARVRALWRRALELASRAAGEPLADWRAAEIIAAEGSSGRPPGVSLGDRALLAALRLVHCARRSKRAAGDGAVVDGAASGATFPHDASVPGSAALDDRAAAVAAASAGVGGVLGPEFYAISRPTDAARVGHRTDATRAESPPCTSASYDAREPCEWHELCEWREPPCESAAASDSSQPRCESAVPSDPFAADARLVEAMRALRTIEPRIGRLLRVMVDHRFYRTFGCRTFDDYVRERLGISVRKAWALLRLEKATLRSDDFGRAYRDGRLSWVRALTLLPVLDRDTAAAWITRAESVTVRRLSDEVDWVLAARDAIGPSVGLAPPPVESRLSPPVRGMLANECRDLAPVERVQNGAHVVGSKHAGGVLLAASTDAENRHSASAGHSASAFRDALAVCDAEIRFTGPASVVALLRDVLDAFGDCAESRWTALERLLRHVITHWESTPRHPDPVFARDGWRCTVPACSSRRSLHDHHVRFRSRGGDNRRDNRTAVCAAHHLHGIHDGTISASGLAPHAIEWRLGVRPDGPPLLAFVGDRYVPTAAPGASVTDESTPTRGLG